MDLRACAPARRCPAQIFRYCGLCWPGAAANWPRSTLAVANSFHNQLELPILFYVLTILAYITHHAGLAFVLLAWVFVVLRLMQAGVHVTNNKVPLRGAFFGASALVLAIMWLMYMIEIILGI